MGTIKVAREKRKSLCSMGPEWRCKISLSLRLPWTWQFPRAWPLKWISNTKCLGDDDASGRQHVLDHAQAKRKAEVEPHCSEMNLGRKADILNIPIKRAPGSEPSYAARQST